MHNNFFLIMHNNYKMIFTQKNIYKYKLKIIQPIKNRLDNINGY